jgi:hypothetical protein
VEVPTLLLNVTNSANQSNKIDSTGDIEVVTLAATEDITLTILYELYRDTVSIAAVTDQKVVENDDTASVTLREILALTWVDATLGAGAHVYEIRVTVSGVGLNNAVAHTRAMNVITFG